MYARSRRSRMHDGLHRLGQAETVQLEGPKVVGDFARLPYGRCRLIADLLKHVRGCDVTVSLLLCTQREQGQVVDYD